MDALWGIIEVEYEKEVGVEGCSVFACLLQVFCFLGRGKLRVTFCRFANPEGVAR